MVTDVQGGQASPSVNWVKWRNMRTAMLWQLVRLSIGIEPDPVTAPSAVPQELMALYKERLQIAMNHVAWDKNASLRAELPPVDQDSLAFAVCTLSDFRDWARALPDKWHLPKEYPGMSTCFDDADAEAHALPEERPPGVPAPVLVQEVAMFLNRLSLRSKPQFDALSKVMRGWGKMSAMSKRLSDPSDWILRSRVGEGAVGKGQPRSLWNPVTLLIEIARRAKVSATVFDPMFIGDGADPYFASWRVRWYEATAAVRREEDFG